MRLLDKNVIVTGGSRGIGAAIAECFAREGAKVIINYHSNECKAAEVCERIKCFGGTAIAVKGDVGCSADMATLVDAAMHQLGGLDVFVNNAGCATLQTLDEIGVDDIERQTRTNITGLILGTQAAARRLNNGGRIINITSIAAKGGAGGSVYSATKAAGNALTKCYASELGARGITVNAVAPAAVETDLYFEVGLDQHRERSLEATPLGRSGDVLDVAKAALFFASEDAAWITGEILQVSGGRAM